MVLIQIFEYFKVLCMRFFLIYLMKVIILFKHIILIKMTNFPAEIWEKIIIFAYPFKESWHNDLWKISRISKMHYNLILYLFLLFIKKPIFTGHLRDDTALKNICKYMQMHIFTYIFRGFFRFTKKFLRSKNVRKYMQMHAFAYIFQYGIKKKNYSIHN